MSIILLQQTDAGSVDAIGAFGTGATAPSTTLNGAYVPKGFTATNGGAAGVANGAGGVAGVNPDAQRWGISFETAAGECDAYGCPAGNWVVPLNCNAGTGTLATITWTDCYVIRVNSSGVGQQTIGHTSGMTTHPPTGGGIISATVAGGAATFAAGDRVVILCTFAFSSATAGVGFISNQIITTPMTGLSITRAVNRFLSSLVGLDSGSRSVYSIAGCARAASAAVKYVASFLGLTSGSQQIFSIASCLGAIRRALYIGLDSGSRQVYGIADCCPQVGDKSGSSGSGTSGSGAGGGFRTGGGCGPDNPCGPPQPTPNLPGCDLTAYPSTLYLTVTNVGAAAACNGFPSSFTVPLFWMNTAQAPIFNQFAPQYYTFNNCWLGWYTLPNATNYYPYYGVPTNPVVYCVLRPCYEGGSSPTGYGSFSITTQPSFNDNLNQTYTFDWDLLLASVETMPGLHLQFSLSEFLNHNCQTGKWIVTP